MVGTVLLTGFICLVGAAALFLRAVLKPKSKPASPAAKVRVAPCVITEVTSGGSPIVWGLPPVIELALPAKVKKPRAPRKKSLVKRKKKAE